ncbi:hypothetical protein CONPUDRAFT_81796 [Coniophora puteana RWD-64-598 SS2]|uniref:RRM domain-containing protein n=1 Tax=Coniophora puteana (strain RWD-64-598) TaxID=741705 RepID=A0A5M3MSW8_CONPW|nr:uncharacterized protein CONPUDRAFT_81796 [Coniophora puteana RWD-64-598 SS2]EIW82268.1 hypothetical protein CONPUDRAFT_81796 [Coniophora puteana RWD-64-598 SS2]
MAQVSAPPSNTGSGMSSPEAFTQPSTMIQSDSPHTSDFMKHTDGLHHPTDLSSRFAPQSSELFAQDNSTLLLRSPHQGGPGSGALSPHQAAMNEFASGPFRSSFSAFNGSNGSGTGTPGANGLGGTRMRQQSVPATHQSFSSSDAHGPLGLQQQLSQQGIPSNSAPFDSRANAFELGSPTSIGGLKGGQPQQFITAMDAFHSHPIKPSPQQVHDTYQHLNTRSGTQMSYMNGVQLQSQTPYGPHLQSNGSSAGLSARVLGNSAQIGLGAGAGAGMTAEGSPAGNLQQEEISTIFVVGFPEDMQEREFQNMFTFSAGFEAATLKIPNKEYTAYGSSGGPTGVTTPSGIPLRSSNSFSSAYLGGGSNDPYNLVTVNQGGVVVDNGRDGPTTSWPPLATHPLDDPSPFGSGPSQQGQGGPGSQPPRKQIIGFAKFRTRQEALEARDVLQGRRVDIEKGAILKAEMAKKNLHTKRGPGNGVSTSTPTTMSAGSGGVASGGLTGVNVAGGMNLGNMNADALAGLAANLSLNHASLNPLAGLNGDASSIARGRDFNSVGFNERGTSAGWRERLGDSSEDETDVNLNRERRREALSAMGLSLGVGLGLRGARERAQAEEDQERDRFRRKDWDKADVSGVAAPRRLPGPSAAYEAFHSVPPGLARYPSGGAGGILAQSASSPGESGMSSPLLGHRDSAIGLWDPPSLRDREVLNSSQPLSLYARRGTIVAPSSQEGSPPGNQVPFSPQELESVDMLPQHRAAPNRAMNAFASSEDQLRREDHHIPTSLPPSSSATSTSSVGGDGDSGAPLAVATGSRQVVGSAGPTSPQLHSPSSNTGSATSGGGPFAGSLPPSMSNSSILTGPAPRGTVVDQNPPINTLYVGNLPTGPMPNGYPAGYLEDSLRELFSRQPGYRKLCFRQKSNGPMCFVEVSSV